MPPTMRSNLVLLIEDHAADAELVRDVFGREGGFQLEHSSTLAAGLAWLSANVPDLILIDLTLPDAPGLDGLREIRHQAPSVPIVALAADDDEALGARAVMEGAQDYLRKGALTSDELARATRHAIARSRTETHLRLFQRLEAVGHLAGGVAHDFNNLLMVILGSAELLSSDRGLSEEQRDLLNEIMQAGRRGADLTRKLLAFSRQQVMSRRPVDLGTILGDLEALLERSLGEDIILEVVLEPNLPLVMADASQLEQVVMNLAFNAREAMPQGGRLRISTAERTIQPQDPWLADHQPQQPGRWVVLAVRDTGPGLPKGLEEKIFEPFFSTKEHGTGLGLSTVYGIIKQSDGFVWGQSSEGFGACFEVFLPALDGPIAPETHKEREDSKIGRQPRRILLVEDDPNVRQLTATLLTQAGHSVITAGDGLDALTQIDENPVDLIITDVIMPRLSGPAMIRRLRDKGIVVPVLYVSGYTTRQMAHHGLLDPAENLLLKPFSRDELLRKIDQVVG
jgi:signal transduction histidine kinase